MNKHLKYAKKLLEEWRKAEEENKNDEMNTISLQWEGYCCEHGLKCLSLDEFIFESETEK